MRLEHYLNEAIDDPIDIIKRDVKKEFLNETLYKRNLLYRSVRKHIDTFAIFKSRSDRKPLDSTKIQHEMMDKMFLKHFGWKARSEGVFASFMHAYDGSTYYGTQYVFFPLGEYKYIWSPAVADATQTIEVCTTKYRSKKSTITKGDYLKKIEDCFKITTFKTTDLNDASFSNSEVMFKCDSYLLLNKKYGDAGSDYELCELLIGRLR